ncbi:MAG: glutamine synthetase family protein [Candidatus Heimdallarchaeaceae archaeon]
MITEEVTKEIVESVKYVNLQFTDIVGHLRSITVTKSELGQNNFLEFGLDGSSIEGFTSVDNSDLLLKPVFDTFVVYPWDKRIGRIFCEIVEPSGEPFPGDTRFLLKRYLDKIEKEFNYKYFTGSEIEFFLVDGKKPSDNASYFSSEYLDFHSYFRLEMAEILEHFGIKPEFLHHEVAPGQHEINFRYAEALRTADNIQTYKFIVRKLASNFNLIATFMPKPFINFNGSGMHIHQSLVDKKTNNNVFNGENGLSELGKMFIAGLIKYSKEILLFLAPTVNSYKRLVPGFEAPIYSSWGIGNRSTLIRIPTYKLRKNRTITVEFRASDPTCNPYIAFAVLLAAGMKGIREKLEPPEQVSKNLFLMDVNERREKYPLLPTSLIEALENSKKNHFLKEVLGEHIFNSFIGIKEKEFQEYSLVEGKSNSKEITKWEWKKYLNY